MDDVYYSTGQAARELGVTQAKVRSLCETEAIDSTSTAGGQYRIRRDEVERLKRDGLPPIPRPLPEPDRPTAAAASRSRRRQVALPANPSEAIVDSAEEVVCLENEVQAIGLRRQKEEGLDWFRERDNREAAQRAEREENERRQQAQAEVDRQRQLWEMRWTGYALRIIPREAPPAYKLDVHRAVEEALQRLNSTQPEWTTRQLVVAAVKSALAPWYELKQIADAIREACEGYGLPWDMKHDSTWKARMQEAAAAGVARVRNGATGTEIETAARQAIMPLVREFEHGRMCTETVKGVWLEVSGADSDQLEEGKEAVRRALAQLPVGTSRREVERARVIALEPTRAAIAARQEREMREGLLQYISFRFTGWPDRLQKQTLDAIRDAFNSRPAGTPKPELERTRDQVVARFRGLHEHQEKKTRSIESGLRQIQPYLAKLAVEWEFDKGTVALAQELQGRVRVVLEEELQGDEAPEDVDRKVRRIVRRELDL